MQQVNKLYMSFMFSLSPLHSSRIDLEKRLILKWSIFQLKSLVDPRRQQGLGDRPFELLTPSKQKLLQFFIWKIMKQLSRLQSFRLQLGAANSFLLLVRQRILCFHLDHVLVVTYGRTSLQMEVQDWSSSTRYVRFTRPLWPLLMDCIICFFKTEVDDVPLALLAFQGRLVAGVGKALRIYDIGKKKLLRKVENKVRLF